MNPTTANIARLDDWLDRLAAETDQARHSAAFVAYLGAMSRFWRYSQQNSLLIFIQRPTATHVGGRTTLWEPLGYTVKKDAWRHAIQILRPQTRTIHDEETGEEHSVIVGYRTCYVYDYSQVEAGPHAQPLDAPWQRLHGDHDALYGLLVAASAKLNIRVAVRMDLPATVEGVSDGYGVITLNGRSPRGNQAQTICHELAHEIVHPRALRQQFSRQEVECQAEAINYCVLTALGIAPANSGTYLALYGVTKDVLRSNAQAVQRGVKTILAAVEAVTGPATPRKEVAA